VLQHLVARLDELAAKNAVAGQVVVVPAANPTALSQFVSGSLLGRFELFSGRNFNRGFPDLTEAVAAGVRGKLTADAEKNRALVRREALAAIDRLPPAAEDDEMRRQLLRLAVDADVALDLHADGQSLLHIYTDSVHRLPAEALAVQMGAEVLLLGVDRKAFSFDDTINLLWSELAGRFPEFPLPAGCLAATLEMRGRIDVSDALARQDAEHLVTFLMRRGILQGDPGTLPASRIRAVSPLQALAQVRAPAGGVAVFHRSPGDVVRRGEILADIVDPFAEDPLRGRHPVPSPADGLLFSRNLSRFVQRHQTFCKVIADEVLSDRRDGFLEP
jgi:predicted deacylase